MNFKYTPTPNEQEMIRRTGAQIKDCYNVKVLVPGGIPQETITVGFSTACKHDLHIDLGTHGHVVFKHKKLGDNPGEFTYGKLTSK